MDLAKIAAMSAHIKAYSPNSFNFLKELIDNIEHERLTFQMSAYFYYGNRGMDISRALIQLGFNVREDTNYDDDMVFVTVSW